MKGKIRMLSGIVFPLLVLGCGGPSYTVRHSIPIIDFRTTDTLLLGQPLEKTVGESMIEKTVLLYLPGFVAQSDYTPPVASNIQMPLVRNGSKWECGRKYKDGGYRCATPDWGFLTVMGISYPVTGSFLAITPDGRACGIAGVNDYFVAFPEIQPAIFDPTEMAQPERKGSCRQELIYNGTSRDAIKILYREFNDTFARPAFYQELTYNLAESREIGFRGMIIEVLEATNSHIRFVVRKPMNP